MAAASPAAVLTRASEMPGATAAIEVEPVCPMARKDCMMPQTVPKRSRQPSRRRFEFLRHIADEDWLQKAGGKLGDRRIGVVWHTQGSGKSLTMAFYAGRIIREPAMENPTLVVLTDRNDLDDQLFGGQGLDLIRGGDGFPPPVIGTMTAIRFWTAPGMTGGPTGSGPGTGPRGPVWHPASARAEAPASARRTARRACPKVR